MLEKHTYMHGMVMIYDLIVQLCNTSVTYVHTDGSEHLGRQIHILSIETSTPCSSKTRKGRLMDRRRELNFHSDILFYFSTGTCTGLPGICSCPPALSSATRASVGDAAARSHLEPCGV